MRRKIGLKIKWLLVDLVTSLGWKHKFKKGKGEVRILVFHGVCLDHEPLINGRFIHLSQLNNLLSSLAKYFHFISIEELTSNKIDKTKLNIICTFDDGYKNNLDLALPVFEKHEIPITIFCNSAPYHLMDLLDISQHWHPELIDQFKSHFHISSPFQHVKKHCKMQNAKVVSKMRNYLWNKLSLDIKEKSKRYWELLSDSDIVLLSQNNLVSFGNHGAEHLSYNCLTEKEMLVDINSVDKRFNRMSIKLNAFAYPYSESSDRIISLVNKAGYDIQFSELNKKDTNSKAKNRLTINPFITTTNQLIAIGKGKY